MGIAAAAQRGSLRRRLYYILSSAVNDDFDRGDKFRHYRRYTPTLTDDVLVSQSLAAIDHYRRLSSDEWTYTTADDLQGSLNISSIDCVLRLSEVYDRVTFPEEINEPEEEH